MVQSNVPFIHLRVHSAYSLAEGAIKVGKLLDACVAQQMPAVAVTDTNNLFGAMEFSLNAVKKGIQPIVGLQADFILPKDKTGNARAEKTPIVLLVQSHAGYLNLCKLNSAMYTQKDAQVELGLTLEMLRGHTDGLICLTGGANGPLASLLRDSKKDAANVLLETFEKLFPNRLYIELTRHEGWDRVLDRKMIQLAHDRNLPLVATNNAYFLKKDFYEAHDALLCIADGRYIGETDRRRETPDHYLKSAAQMMELFADVPEAIESTVAIAKRCAYFLKELKPELPVFVSAEGRSENDELVYQSEQGLKWRLEKYILPNAKDDTERAALTAEYEARLQAELPIIIRMGFPGYFLIVADYIRWAKENNIPVGLGRGSGAGSLVAWAMGIIDIDPIPYRLLFERFLNPERVSMPDFDIDFCQDRRDEVMRYVQEKYGHDHVAQIITFGELKARAVVRDVGRVLQMSYGQVDRISKMIPFNPAKPVTLQEAIDTDPQLRKLRDEDEAVGRLIGIALQLEGMYRHASTHAAGIVIGNKPLDQIVPLYQDPRSTLPATQYNLKYIEQTSLIKFDFLGLKTLTVLQRALENVKASTGVDIDLLALNTDDKKSYELLTKGYTTGIFQFESSGMQDAMRRVKPDRLEDLIALNALYRPGPMQNIPQYGKVKNGEAQAEYPHPKIKPILEETYGIMVYQEQVMEIAKVLAGYTLGGADLLRRAMGKKIKEEMDAQRTRFVDGCKEHSGLSDDEANGIFDLMARFADYGFNKSHSAAYAMMAYHTAYLKANYPVEFMAALMTLDLGDTDKLSLYAQDLARMNIKLLPPDINKSFPHFAVENTEDGKAIRYALAALKGVGWQAMHDLVTDREKSGAFNTLFDLVQRVNAQSFSKKQLEVLAEAGAFDGFKYPRAALVTASDYIMRRIQRRQEESNSGQVSLFAASPTTNVEEPLNIPDLPEWPPLEKLQNEFDAIGFYISAHPLDVYNDWLEKKKHISYRDLLNAQPPLVSARVAGVIVKKVEKRSDRGRFAFVTLSDRTGLFDVTVYTEPLMQYREVLETGRMVAARVDVQWREGEARLILRDLQMLDEAVTAAMDAVHVKFLSPASVERTCQILSKAGHGRIKVTLELPLANTPEQRAIMKMPFPCALQDQTIQQLRGFSDVELTVQ